MGFGIRSEPITEAVTSEVTSNPVVGAVEKAPSESTSTSQRDVTEKYGDTSDIVQAISSWNDSDASIDSTTDVRPQVASGRPVVGPLLNSARESTSDGEEVGVAICGPLSRY
jgi:hypothetical protein